MDTKLLPAFKALADSTRIRILNLLAAQELNVNEIVRVLSTGQSGISRHLKILADSGLVKSRRDGLWSFFSADADGKHAGLLGLLKASFKKEKQLRSDLLAAKKVLTERDQETRRLFDSLAPEWEEMKRDILGSFDLNGEIAGLINRTGTVADLGCGTGDLIGLLALEAGKVIGVDSSPEMIRASRSRFARKNGIVEVRMGEFEHLPLRDEEADAAVCSMVLHHLPDPMQGIREVQRVLKPKGGFVLADLDSHNSEIMRTRYGDRWLGFPAKTIEDWLVKSGFQNIRIKQFPVKRNLTVLVTSADKK